MKDITKKINAYKALIKSKKYAIKELRKCGFKYGSEYGNIFNQVEGFSQACYEATNDL